jgi:hypothetical protein
MINGINYEQFYDDFLQTEAGKRISKDFDSVTCSPINMPSILFIKDRYGTTPRELLGRIDHEVSDPKTTVSIVSLYYINLLQEKNPTKIYDIGCGWNLWKRYIPNIYGVDTNSKFADEIAIYNNDWVRRHEGQLESACMINMDFGIKEGENTTFANLTDHILDFSKILKPGGRGYIATSVFGMLFFTEEEWFKSKNITRYSMKEITDEVVAIVKNLPLKIISLDLEFDIFLRPPNHDGEFRLVFEVLDNVGT